MLDGSSIDVRLQVAARARSLRIVCSIAGTTVFVPRNCSMSDVDAFVTSKKRWLTRMHRHYERMRAKCGGYQPNTIFYLGERYSLRFTRDRQTFASVSESMKIITFHVPSLKEERSSIKHWYRSETRRIVSERLPAIAATMNLSYNKVSIKDVTSRWASCSRNRNLSFSLLLAAAPSAVIDYVIIHELAHIARMDHSAEFWKIVAQADPEYRSHRAWLSDYAPVVRLD